MSVLGRPAVAAAASVPTRGRGGRGGGGSSSSGAPEVPSARDSPLSVGSAAPPMPRQRVRSPSWQWDSDGRSRLRYPPEATEDPSWLRRVREEEPGSGDHANRLPWLRF